MPVVTFVDTLFLSHVSSTPNGAGVAAVFAEAVKRRRYQGLGDTFIFVPLAIEMMDPWALKHDNS